GSQPTRNEPGGRPPGFVVSGRSQSGAAPARVGSAAAVRSSRADAAAPAALPALRPRPLTTEPATSSPAETRAARWNASTDASRAAVATSGGTACFGGLSGTISLRTAGTVG